MHYKCNANLISHQPDIDKIYLHVKYQHEPKYLLLINQLEWVGSKHINDYKAFIEYSSDIDDIHENIYEYKSNNKRKILIPFGTMTVDMLSNKQFEQNCNSTIYQKQENEHFSRFYYTVFY